MSRLWNPRKQTVALDGAPAPRVSRIRREPVRKLSEADIARADATKREREVWGGVTGMVLFALALATIIIGTAVATVFSGDPDADAKARHFGQCFNEFGPNCVLDAGTIRANGETVRIAGMEVPQIQGAQCEAERSRGIDAAVRLANLLNSGKVTLGATSTDPSGREVRSVEVGGRDVGQAMVSMGLAQNYDSATSWCGNSGAA